MAMNYRVASARPLGRALIVSFAAASLLAVALTGSALAQTPPAQAKPAQQPAQPPQQAAAEPAPPQLMYSPWLKVCGKGQETNNKEVCVVTKDGRLENGMPVAIVQLFEPEGEAKVLRVTVPLGMQLQHGTRMMIDQGAPAQQPYKICFPVGCIS